MELKFYNVLRCFELGISFNCTFMELKFLLDAHARASESVLIVPLWN